MAEVITISSVNVSDKCKPGDIEAFFRKHARLSSLQRRPDAVYLSSSSEVACMIEPYIAKAVIDVLEVFPKAKARAVSQGCLGIFSTALELHRDPDVRSVFVMFIEAPAALIQSGLDAAGVGMSEGQKGLEITPSIGCFWLTKKDEADIISSDIIIDRSEIFSFGTRLASMAKTFSHIVDSIAETQEHTALKVVDFKVSAPWSEKLFSSIVTIAERKAVPIQWLPSSEQSSHHYMTMKQLHEIAMYKTEIEQQPLLFLGIGLGGRVGLMRVVSGLHYRKADICDADFEHFPFEEYLYNSRAIVDRGGPDFHHNMIEYTMCLSEKYRGRKNLYFLWDIDVNVLREYLRDETALELAYA